MTDNNLSAAMQRADNQQTAAVAFLNGDRYTKQESRARLVELELSIVDMIQDEKRAAQKISREQERLADIQRTRQAYEILRDQLTAQP